MIAGNGAVRTQAATQRRTFVEATGVPVVSTYMGKGAVSDADERSLMTLAGLGYRRRGSASHLSADLVLTVGYDIAEHDPADWNDGTAPLVHVDSEPAEVYESYDPDVKVIADNGRTLEALTDWYCSVGADFETGWFADLREGIDRRPRAIWRSMQTSWRRPATVAS